MTFSDKLFDNQEYILTSVAYLIGDERNRIVSSGVAGVDEIDAFINIRLKNTNAEGIAKLHRVLQSFILPGDLKKVAGEEFMDLSSLPELTPKPEEEDFYDLTGVNEEIQKLREKNEEGPEDPIEPTEDEGWEDDESESDEIGDLDPKELTAKKVVGELQKLAHSLGSQGQHGAAYAIERTIQAIHRDVRDGKLTQNGETR